MDGYITIGTNLDTKNFDAEIKYVENKIEEITAVLSDKNIELDVRVKNEAELEKLQNKLIQLKKQQSQIGKTDFSPILKGIENVGNSTTKAIRKVGQWALAIFGIRSAYMAVRSAMSTLSQYDEQMATNVEYIRYALAYMLKPVVETLINLAFKLLTYINYIAKAWFGVDLFANASAKSFQKAKDGIAGANKEAKKLNKQLAGFDEMNILQENGGTAAGGGGGGTPLPSFDLAAPDNVPIPEWLQWIIDNKDIVLSTLAGIAAALLLIKLGLDPLMGLGIGIAIAGIVFTIQSLIKYIKDPSWTNFGNIIKGIGIAIIGVGVAIGGIPVIIAGALTLALGFVIEHWEKIKGFFQRGIDWIAEKVGNFGDKWGGFVKLFANTFINQLQSTLDFFDNTFKTIKNIFDGIIQFITGIFTGNWKKAFNGLYSIVSGVFDLILNTIKFTFNTIKNLAIMIGSVVGEIISEAIKGVVNGVLTIVEGTLNVPISAINKLLSVINKTPGVNISKLNKIKLPRLAVGGIVNMPGRGVPVGGAIAGERGAEGVIPLTNSQQMALLGEAIGKYITINANITNTMNGRVISRELQKVQNNSDFAFNR